jgi:hypothetical protein
MQMNYLEPARQSPLIVLGPARSYTTVVTAMLGQHPQMYSFPETHLLMTRTMAEWLARFGGRYYSHGLLRLVAELIVGAQTEAAIEGAKIWITQRLCRPSAEVFCELAEYVSPRMPIDKSPLMVQNAGCLRLAHLTFPTARYLHLTRHPVGHGISMLKFADELLILLGLQVPTEPDMRAYSPRHPYVCRTGSGITVIDPQIQWYREHSNILGFLAGVAPSRQMRVRGEDLLSNPELVLRDVTAWLGLRFDKDVMYHMRHPERWAFANVGPPSAQFGNDPNFCRQPALRVRAYAQESLDDALPWRSGKVMVNYHVRRLAERFGYA